MIRTLYYEIPTTSLDGNTIINMPTLIPGYASKKSFTAILGLANSSTATPIITHLYFENYITVPVPIVDTGSTNT
jgi:hypothetical protein